MAPADAWTRQRYDQMIALVELSDADFADFSKRSISDYAAHMIESGEWSPSMALQNATAMFQEILPQGQRTPTHYFFSIHRMDEDDDVGSIWVKINHHTGVAFLFDIFVDAKYRGRGFASRALMQVEDYARKHGAEIVQLHVFGRNHAAESLYTKLGFSVSHATMTKWL